MKVMAFNGSPRKKWNTAALLEKALEGAVSQGAETRLVHLYELDFKGCLSCFACKKRGGKSYGICAVQDDLTPIYTEIREADVIILGSPIYLGDVTGEMRSFMERLIFPGISYSSLLRSLFPKNIRTAWIYTMNVPEELARQFDYDKVFARNESLLQRVFGHSESLMSYDTLQFEDYSKVVADRFDVEHKQKIHREVFPKDCQRAYKLGVSLAGSSHRSTWNL